MKLINSSIRSHVGWHLPWKMHWVPIDAISFPPTYVSVFSYLPICSFFSPRTFSPLKFKSVSVNNVRGKFLWNRCFGFLINYLGVCHILDPYRGTRKVRKATQSHWWVFIQAYDLSLIKALPDVLILCSRTGSPSMAGSREYHTSYLLCKGIWSQLD